MKLEKIKEINEIVKPYYITFIIIFLTLQSYIKFLKFIGCFLIGLYVGSYYGLLKNKKM